jgi:hypothetical protein
MPTISYSLILILLIVLLFVPFHANANTLVVAGTKYSNCSTRSIDSTLATVIGNSTHLPMYLRVPEMYYFQCESIKTSRNKFMIQRKTMDICETITDEECQKQYCDTSYNLSTFIKSSKLLACMHCRRESNYTILDRIYGNDCNATYIHFSKYDHLCGYTQETWDIQHGIPEFSYMGWLLNSICYCPVFDTTLERCTEKVLHQRAFYFISHYILFGFNIASLVFLVFGIIVPFVAHIATRSGCFLQLFNVRLGIMILLVFALLLSIVEDVEIVCVNKIRDVFRGASYIVTFIAELFMVIHWINVLAHVRESDSDMSLNWRLRLLLVLAIVMIILPLLFLILVIIGIPLLSKTLIMFGDLATLSALFIIANILIYGFLIWGTKLFLFIKQSDTLKGKSILGLKFTRFMIVNSAALLLTNSLLITYVSNTSLYS